MVAKLPPVSAAVVKRTEASQPTAPTTTPAAVTEQPAAGGWKAGTAKAKGAPPPLSQAEAQRFKKAAEDAQRSQAEALARQGGLTVRAAINGTVGTLNQAFDASVGAAVNGAVNLANRTLGTSIPTLPSTAQHLEANLDRTLPKPETATERVVQQVAGAMASAGAMGAVSGAVHAGAATNATVRAVAGELSANHVANLASAVGSAGAGSLTQEAGGGPVAQAVARIVGGFAPAAISNGVRQAHAAATAVRTATSNAEAARTAIKDLRFEFTRANSNQDPAVLKPLLEQLQKLKADGHVFSKLDLRLMDQVQSHLARGVGPATYGTPGTFDSI